MNAAANNSGSPRAEVPAHSSINLAAAQNVVPEVFDMLSALGLAVVIVVFENIKQGHPSMNHGNLAEKLGRELQEARAGEYDSTAWLPEQHWHFYHGTDLPKAIATLKAGLERRGLLRYAKIFNAESPTELMTWWPPTAEKIVHIPA